jgi:hypothetical protein
MRLPTFFVAMSYALSTEERTAGLEYLKTL